MSFVRSSVLVDFLDFVPRFFLNLVITVAVGCNSLYCGYNSHSLICNFYIKAYVVRPVCRVFDVVFCGVFFDSLVVGQLLGELCKCD